MMKVIIFTVCLTLLLRLSVGVAQVQTMAMDHSHLPIAVPAEIPVPALSLALEQDAMSGYNLTINTQNYVLTPPPAGISMNALMSAQQDPKTGMLAGHAHLYINGVKIQRVYGQYVHLPTTLFSAGINTISVTLNNHGHMYWSAQDKKIVATLYINDQVDELITYRFESFPVLSKLAKNK
ncbi:MULTISPECIES: hypothetical protein [unclassified Pseudoalteromonas]|uniref:hypothetical protein n=1 Tax=unclassified Pseudoalteromonas TaxID=194690 RepID=UPI001FCBD296|nr:MULTISPECIES: hypothetical protein [unclassified Pseudoalteromonas]